MNEYRRYEILLPRRSNDGRRVPPALLRQTFRELEARFGAVSVERQTIIGAWRESERTYQDELVRMFVDVPVSSGIRSVLPRSERNSQGALSAIGNLDYESRYPPALACRSSPGARFPASLPWRLICGERGSAHPSPDREPSRFAARAQAPAAPGCPVVQRHRPGGCAAGGNFPRITRGFEP